MNSLADDLHDLEKKVLLVLKEFNGVTSDVISEKSGLKDDSINKAVELLKDKKLIEVEDINKDLFRATELGIKYADQGLPEHRFLDAAEKPVSMKSIKKAACLDDDEFNVSIGICKKGELIAIRDGMISVTETGKAYLKEVGQREELLAMLKDKKYEEEVPSDIDNFLLPLEERKLIERSIEKIKRLRLTDAGKKILPHIKFEKRIDMLTPEIIKSREWKTTPFKKYDLDIPTSSVHIGKKQPYMKFIDDVKQKLVSLGFEEEPPGPYVEFNFFNNDALYMPQDHPARDIHDYFSLKHPKKGDLSKYRDLLEKVKQTHESGWETGSTGWKYKFDPARSAELLLRSQATAVSARTLSGKNLKIPGKYFTYDRVFRVDEIDWKHLIEFNQFDGIVLDKDISFRELLGILIMAAKELAGATKFKFAPGYFPFTEPSVELHAYVEGKGWVELGGAGVFRPELTEPLGIDVPVIAWGLGMDRLFMLRYGVQDIRQLFSTDLKWLRDFRW